MRYTHWIWTEIKESKLFTFLNVVGIWINILLILIFLAFALGIEQSVTYQITKNIDLYTIEVSPKKTTDLLPFSDKLSIDQENKNLVKQVIPVYTEYADLKFYKSIESQEDNKINQNPKRKELASVRVYTESYSHEAEKDIDLRTNYLKLISGKKPTYENPDGIIVSNDVFRQLANNSDELNIDNYQQQDFNLVVKRSDNKVKSFKCKIVGIADTTYHNGVLAYIASPLATQINYWLNFTETPPQNYQDRQYERMDVVANNLDDLKKLRTFLKKEGYKTSSVLDRVDNAKNIINMVKIVFFIIIGISGVIAAFNILITLTSYVLKRKREIGILKALGATDIQIQTIFILHGVYLCLMGSILGVVTSYILVKLGNFILSKFPNYKDITLFKMGFNDVITVVVFCLLLGIVAASIPARKAASISPIETMRSA